MSAKVTREHRALARDVLYFDDAMLRGWVETGKSQVAGRADRVAQALADTEAAAKLEGKREVLEEMRLAMNEFMKGKGLYVDPGEALAIAFDSARAKYAAPTEEKP